MYKAKILIVDDNEVNRKLLNDMTLALGHQPVLAENGLSALAKMREDLPDLVLLDILMPEMNGHEVLEHMRSDNTMRHLPVIVVSALEQKESILRCIENGADDYLIKPYDTILLKARIEASLEKKQLRDSEEAYRLNIEDYNLNLEKRVREQVKKITSAQLSTIFAMAKLAESRDPKTGEHLLRLQEYCRIICNKLRCTSKYELIINDDYIENICAAVSLHDIGKVGIPDKILQKPGKLSYNEFSIMKTHCSIGASTLQEVSNHYPANKFLHYGIEIAMYHHEKWTGKGYPQGRAGEKIPLSGRIVCLVDVFDALTSRRSYKGPYPIEIACDIIKKERGEQFDPTLVDLFLENIDEIIEVKEKVGTAEDIALDDFTWSERDIAARKVI